MFSSRHTLAVFFVAAMSSLYLGCGGSDGKDGANGQNGQNGQDGKDGISTLVISTQEPAGQRCANGGIKVEIGADTDGDGILTESETKATQYICNGENGQQGTPGTPGTPGVSQTISTSAVAAGADGCVNGGIKITISDGTTSKDAVICNGENGTGSSGDVPSISTSVVPEGDANCANGGVKIEVTSGGSTSTQYACNGTNGQPGAPGTSPSIATTKLDPGDATCANGGVKIEISVAGTVTDTRYVCNGANGSDGTGTPGTPGTNGHNSLISMTDYTGAACASGTGLQIVSWLDLNDNGKLDEGEETEKATTKIICNGTNGGGASGCAAEGEDYCLSQAVANNNNLGICDTTTGNCVECMKDTDCGTDGAKACVEKTCVDKCGDGKVTDGELCDPAADPSLWTIPSNQCADHTANLGEGYTGTVTCNGTCAWNYTECREDPCANVTSDEECVTGADGGPQTCADALFGESTTALVVCEAHATCQGIMVVNEAATEAACADDPCANVHSDGDCTGTGPNNAKTCLEAWGDEVTVPSAYVVCEEHPTCPGVYLENIDATLAVCEPDDPPPEAPTSWCNTQWPGSITAAGTDVYGRVPPSAKDSITMKLVYGTDVANIATWASIPASYDKEDGNNSQFKATMDAATYDALAAGTYYYAMAISGDNTHWFYCAFTGQQNDGSNDNGSAPPASTLTTDLMGTMVIESDVPPAPVTYTQNFDFMSKNSTSYKDTESATVGGITWAYYGRTNLYSQGGTSGDYYGINDWVEEGETNPGKAVFLRYSETTSNSNGTSYIQATGLSGVTSVAFTYGFWNTDRTEIQVVSYNSKDEVLETKKTTTMAVSGSDRTGTASVSFGDSSSAAVKVRITVASEGKRVAVDDVVITK